jgi:gamma-glutamyltranspeptidase/glutathione hydrolase
MGVLQTDKVSFGGVAPQIIYFAKKKEIHCIDGLGVWPKAITPDYFQKITTARSPRAFCAASCPRRPTHGSLRWSVSER